MWVFSFVAKFSTNSETGNSNVPLKYSAEVEISLVHFIQPFKNRKLDILDDYTTAAFSGTADLGVGKAKR